MAINIEEQKLNAKVFDTVPHKHLIYKLRSAGLDHRVCAWVKKLVTGTGPKGSDK